MNKKILGLASVVIAIIAIVGSYNYPKNETKVVNNYTTPEATQNVGAVTGPDQYFEYTANNDLKTFGGRKRMTLATSTLCAYYVRATSTLPTFTAVISSSTAVTATQYVLATSSTAFATTSIITSFGIGTSTYSQSSIYGTTTLATGAQGNLVFTSPALNPVIINPGTWLVFGVQGGLGNFGTAAQVGGSCQAQIIQL